jgi:tRNA (Thr-GGU) A37 N-methylase
LILETQIRSILWVRVLINSQLLLLLTFLAPADGLQGYSHVWLIFLFHENNSKVGIYIMRSFPIAASAVLMGSHPPPVHNKVAPPRLEDAKVGVFATRSPHRPNPIGLSVARLIKIVSNCIYLSGLFSIPKRTKLFTSLWCSRN